MISYDNANSAVITGTGSNTTGTVTLTVGTDNPVLTCSVIIPNTTALSSVKIGTTAFTKIGGLNDGGGNTRVELWYLKSPPTGSQTITVTYGAAIGLNSSSLIGAISLTGVNQTAPLGASSTAGGTSTPGTKALTTTVNNSWIIDVIEAESIFTPSSLLTNNGNTARFNTTWTLNTNISLGGGSTLPTTNHGSITDGWKWTDGFAGASWAYILAEFIPAGNNPADFFPFFYT